MLNGLSILLIIPAIGFVSGCIVRISSNVDWKDVGGKQTSIDHLPYHLQVEVLAEKWIMHCGAAIYGKDIAVTTASCAVPLKEDLDRIRLIPSSSVIKEGRYLEVLEIIEHPKTKGARLEIQYDIAVMKFSPPLEFSKDCKPIEIADDVPSVGEIGMAGGYGDRGIDSYPSTHMRTARVEIIDHEICEEKYLKLENITITDQNLCVSYPDQTENHRDACIQETGSPFAIDGKLVGLAGIDRSCTKYGFPGLFVNVPMFKDWIEETAAKLEKGDD